MSTITTFKNYIDQLDEVYKYASLSSVLDGDVSTVRKGANAHEIVIPKYTAMDGLAEYSRSTGYYSGDITLSNETVALNFDRGRSFVIDAMDDEETAGVAFGKLSAEFIRTKVAPELDAFRFAQYAGTSGISKVAAGATLSTGAEVIAALAAAVDGMDNDEVPAENRYLFITPTLLGLVRDLDTTKSREVLEQFAQITKVPQTRFYTKIDQYDGHSSGETAGGYIKDDTDGKDINFMVIHKPALIQFTKHEVSKIITPEMNQDADAWKFCFRSYGVADVYDQKVGGIYLHHKAS